MDNPLNFLKKKYNLHNSPEVTAAARRTEIREGEKVSQNPEDQIQNYLDRFKEILDRKDSVERSRGIKALKQVLYRSLIIKKEKIPLEYFLDQEQKVAEQQGHGRPEPTADWIDNKTKEIQEGQIRSLDAWIDYITSPDALYPDWAKYWAFRSMTQMGGYNKKEGKYSKRTNESSQPFPTLNRACLGKTISLIQQQVKLQGLSNKDPNRIKIEKDLLYALNHDTNYREIVSTENFAKLYTHALEQFSGMSWNHLENINGEWKTYEKDSDPQELYDSLQGFPLEWCTATNIETAREQLQGGDFHVYYSQDEKGVSVVPRLAIRMQGNSIAEVRGIEKDQNIDQFIQPVIDEKLKGFGSEGDRYLKKSSDMKHMTEITAKHRGGIPLNQSDLVFLYEINSPIRGFGYENDPRIEEVRSLRNSVEDAGVVLGYTQAQIATNIDEVTKDTKVYIGPLEIGILDKLSSEVEHIYTKFAEGKIVQKEFILGSGAKTFQEFEDAMTSKGYEFSDGSENAMKQSDFTVSNERKKIDLVVVSVESLGFPNGAEYSQIKNRAQELGFQLAPAELGPQLRLQYDDQPNDESLYIGMKEIGKSIFNVVRFLDGEAWLDATSADKMFKWERDTRFVFVRPRK